MLSFWSLLISFSVVPTALTVCPDGWIRRHQSCYFVSEGRFQYDDSVVNCGSVNASLANVDDVNELEFLRSLINRFPTERTSDHFYWIDGVRNHNNHWFRKNGNSPLTFFAWGTGEPNNRFGGENCLALYNKVNFYFTDTSCYENGQYICELRDTVQSCIQTAPPSSTSSTKAWIQLG